MSTPAQLAKAALRRLAMAQQEPTPENYARAWTAEGGEGAASGEAWALLIERITRGLEAGSGQWTRARKKDSLQRVLEGSRSDAQRLQQRLRQLVAGWEKDDRGGEPASTEFGATGFGGLDPDTLSLPAAGPATDQGSTAPPAAASAFAPLSASEPGAVLGAESAFAALSAFPSPHAALDARAEEAAAAWPALVAELHATVGSALPAQEERARELADELAGLADRIAREGATAALAEAVAHTCQRARRVLAHRHHLVDELTALCRELVAGLSDLAEDDSWAKGQAQALQARLVDEEPTARSVRAAGELLGATRAQQRALRAERDRAREALKALVHSLLTQLSELDAQTGRFSESLGHYAEVIEGADSIDSLAGLVREMVNESRAVQAAVGQAHQRLQGERAQAGEMEARVRELEGELRRLSDEVSTDALTQVANRRGMMQAFETERARLERDGSALAVGLLDIDNFKRLNDTLGHAAGDTALKALAAKVRDSLRPVDHVARYGGEEFVVLLPGTAVEEAQQVLTRLQRKLSAGLFMHEAREVFVTFSAGVTRYREGERLEAALERADEALYEAKRTGKNRTCLG